MFFPVDLFTLLYAKKSNQDYVNKNQSFLGFWVSVRENQAFD